MNRHTVVVIINFFAFQLLWVAAVLGGSQGAVVPAWGVLATMLVAQIALTRQWKQDIFLITAGGLMCALMEPLWLLPEALQYKSWQQHWWAPPWVWALWMGFAASFRYSLSWLCGRPVFAALFGGLGGVFSVMMGIRLGAATAPQGWLLLAIIYGISWAIAVPLLAKIASMTKREDQHA
ncbi:MAG: DUF2878 domain-containing protein [Alcanivorax sp.]